MSRRRTVAYVVTVGTRVYLARGADPDHALEHVRRRYGFALEADDVKVREADAGDLELVDLIGALGETDEIRAWRDAARRQVSA